MSLPIYGLACIVILAAGFVAFIGTALTVLP